MQRRSHLSRHSRQPTLLCHPPTSACGPHLPHLPHRHHHTPGYACMRSGQQEAGSSGESRTKKASSTGESKRKRQPQRLRPQACISSKAETWAGRRLAAPGPVGCRCAWQAALGLLSLLFLVPAKPPGDPATPPPRPVRQAPGTMPTSCPHVPRLLTPVRPRLRASMGSRAMLLLGWVRMRWAPRGLVK